MLDTNNHDFLQNPYPTFEKLQKEHAVIYWKEKNKFIVTGYEAVKDLMRNKAFVPPGTGHKKNFPDWNEVISTHGFPLQMAKAQAVVQDWLVLFEDEQHLVIRKALMRCFTPEQLQKLEEKCTQICQEVLEEKKGKELDIISEYALPISMKVLLGVMGWNYPDYLGLKKHSTNILNYFKLDASKKDEFLAASSILELSKLFLKVITGEITIEYGVISELKGLYENKEISLDEFIGNCIFFLFAGQESSQLFIGSTVFLTNTLQDRSALHDAVFLDSYLEEVLRFECPNPFFNRIATQDLEWQGVQIPKGAKLMGIVNAANRDADKFEQPQKFDPTRKPNGHISFGVGGHYCLGAYLARVEAKVALKELFKSQPNINIPQKVEWINNFRIRGISSLKVHVE